MTTRGPGGLVRFTRTRFIARSGHRLMFRSSVLAVDSDSAMAGARSVFFRWGRGTISLRGIGGIVEACGEPMLTDLSNYNPPAFQFLHLITSSPTRLLTVDTCHVD